MTSCECPYCGHTLEGYAMVERPKFKTVHAGEWLREFLNKPPEEIRREELKSVAHTLAICSRLLLMEDCEDSAMWRILDSAADLAVLTPGLERESGRARLILKCEEKTPRRGVYFVQAGDSGPIKIGFSDDVDARITGLQTANPQPLRLLRIIRGTAKDEAAYHARFASARLRGEWFQPTPEVLEVANGRDCGPLGPSTRSVS